MTMTTIRNSALLAALLSAQAVAFVPNAVTTRNARVRLPVLTSPKPEHFGSFDPTVLVREPVNMPLVKEEDLKQAVETKYVSSTWQGLTGPTKAFTGLAAMLAVGLVTTAPGMDAEFITQLNTAAIGTSMTSFVQGLNLDGITDLGETFSEWSSNMALLTETARLQSQDTLATWQTAQASWSGQFQDAAFLQMTQFQQMVDQTTLQAQAAQASWTVQFQDVASSQMAQVQQMVDQTQAQAQTAISGMSMQFDEFQQQATQTMGDFQSSMTTQLASAQDVTTSTVQAMTSQVTDYSQDLMAKVMAWFQQMMASIDSDWAQVLKAKISQFSANAQGSVAEQSKTIGSTMSLQMSDLTDKAQSATQELKASIESISVPNLVDTSSMSIQIQDTMPDALPAAIVNKVEVVKEAVANTQMAAPVPEPSTATATAAVREVSAPVSNWKAARQAASQADAMQYSSLMQKLN